MQLISFLVGLVVGWLTGPWVEPFLQGKRSQALEGATSPAPQAKSSVKVGELREKLSASQERVKQLTAQAKSAQDEATALRVRLAEAESKVQSLQTALSAARETVVPDALDTIEGVGPKTMRILYDHGILTFAQLAETDVERLRALLEEAGSRYRIIDPETWPEQAALAAAEDWDGLKALQATLDGGRR